ncbi:MAG: hypothetical protein CBC35_08990 [Planctomycetes bacterium TMED75]|nr:aromatic acid decarboxylase [Planctomycetaceae bacterium]OUU91707.1 MAG: hypothetical protein CBC35_08990 [Planctomycetes bacterium TMED75]
MNQRRIIVAVTGASGAAYAQRILTLLAEADCEIHLIVSKLGRRLINDELGIPGLDLDALTGGRASHVQLHTDGDVGAAPGSGSFVHDGMVIVPCSANTLGRIAGGMTENLVQRAAACSLKERRKLVICHRETPLTLIEIENMARVTRAGGIIAPMNPGFYLKPTSIHDLVDYMAARVLDVLGVRHELDVHWDEHLKKS